MSDQDSKPAGSISEGAFGGPFGAFAGGALGFGTARVAATVSGAIARSVGAPTRVLVVGDDLGRALARSGLPVVAVSPRPRRRKKGPPQIAAHPEAMPFGDACADVVVTAGLPADAVSALRALARLVRDGGLLAVATAGATLARRPPPPERLAAALVHAALVDIEQHAVGSALVSVARVRKWPAG